MSFHKAIKSGKEHRVEYGTKNQPYCKAVDYTCRNHGTCPYCMNTRTYKNKSKEKIIKNDIKEYDENGK